MPGGRGLDKLAMLAWARQAAAGCARVAIRGWSTSWNDGLALCAILHAYYPESIPLETLGDGHAALERNWELGIKVAEERAGCPRLVETADFAMCYPKPDERSVMTYVSSLWACLRRHVIAREAAAAGIGSSVHVVGTAVGAVVGGVLDAVDVAQTLGSVFHHEANPSTFVMLNPGWNGPLDSKVGQHPEVKRLIYEYNQRQDRTGYNHADADLEELTRQVQTIVNRMDFPIQY